MIDKELALTQQYCLVPLPVADLKRLVGDDFISNFQAEIDPVILPLRKHIAQGRPASMGKELWEYAVADSIVGGAWCGAGKSIVDVGIGSAIGCDVKSVQVGKTTTTEASMFQPLSEAEPASEHFKNKNKQELWKLFVDGWLKKASSIKEYYLLAIFRDRNTFNCSLAAFKVDNISVQYTDDACTFSKKSMKVNSLVDPLLAEIKVYIGKTRLELRIKKSIFSDPQYSMEIYKF
jgi:hypothetical protein